MFQKTRFILFLTLIIAILVACGEPVIPPKIVRHPGPVDYSFINPHPTSIPTYDPNSSNSFQIDFRSSDLVDLDLSKSMDILNLANFDSQTKWPPSNKLPAGFSVQQTMEMGKDPGLGMRDLHKKALPAEEWGLP